MTDAVVETLVEVEVPSIYMLPIVYKPQCRLSDDKISISTISIFKLMSFTVFF
jgi:hypothetical protein